MKRFHLFEFEDFPWFPYVLRDCMTRYILLIHKLLKTKIDLVKLIEQLVQKTKSNTIHDLCSGSGGPMIEVIKQINDSSDGQLELILTDKFPNRKVAQKINNIDGKEVSYKTASVDATNYGVEHKGIRTMVCSLHHFLPDQVHAILKSASDSKQPFLAYEISDNSIPNFLWWIAIPINILMVLLLTPFVRPLSFSQLIFTYLIPVLPLLIAWDGAVSNIRTYTQKDMEIILSEIETGGYQWDTGKITDNGPNKLYLLGYSV